MNRVWVWGLADLALGATAVEGEHGFLVCRTISQVVKSCFQEIPAFCTSVAFAEQWAKRSTPHKDVTPEAADLQHKLGYGIKHQSGGEEEETAKCCGHSQGLTLATAGKTGGSLQRWLIGLFLGARMLLDGEPLQKATASTSLNFQCLHKSQSRSVCIPLAPQPTVPGMQKLRHKAVAKMPRRISWAFLQGLQDKPGQPHLSPLICYLTEGKK